MSSNMFWQRWWQLLRHQPAVWWFALIQALPGLLLMGFVFVMLKMMPSLDAPPFVWEHWFQQQGLPVLVGLGFGSLALALLARVLAWWAQAGIFALARRVLGREHEPLPWAEAREGLAGPTLRLVLVDVALGLVFIAVMGLFFGLLFIIMGTQSDAEEVAVGVLVLLMCLAFPVVLLVAPWIQALRVASVAEHPAGWGETWHAYRAAMSRGWLGMYGMLAVTAVLGVAIGFISQIVRLPLAFAFTWVSQGDETLGLLLQALTNGVLSVLVGVPQSAIVYSGWAALYLHYRHGEMPAPLDAAEASPAETLRP